MAIAAIAAVSAIASGSTSTFEAGTDPFTSLECAHPATQFTRVTSPVREGSYAARFSETATDVWSNGSVRCLAAKYDSGETTGNDYYYHMSFYFPQTLSDNLLWELHHPSSLYNISGACSVAPHALLARSGGNLVYRLFTGNCNGSIYAHQEVISIPGLNPYPRNTWVDFVVHVKFAESNTGALEIYWRKAGDAWPTTPQVSRTGVPTMPYSDAYNVHNVKLYWEMGLYPGYSGYSGSDAVVIDDYRRETSLSAGQSGGADTTPTPPPPATVAPANTSLPQVSGTAQVGQSLTATTGSWSGSPTSYSYRWQVSSNGGTSWVDVAGATGASFAEGSTVQGALARVAVTATNSAGSTTAASTAVGPIAAAPAGSSATSTVVAPASTSLPQVSGTLQVGQTLTTTSGTWTGAPTSYAYQWQYSRDSGATWLNVNGATSTTFQESSTFQSTRIRVRMTATNSSGSATVASASVGPIGASTTTTTTTTASFSVATNLFDGQWFKRKRRAIAWSATASAPVTSVEFWVDGTRGWTDSSSPYEYGASGALDLTPLASGSHTLMVKAIAADGRSASKTITVSIG